MVPGLGTGGSKAQISVGWRQAVATRSYFDATYNRSFTNLWKPYERLSILDVTGRYALTKRTSILATLPIVFNEFSMLYPPSGPGKGLRVPANPKGVGDLAIYSQTWLLDGQKHPFHNVALGAGLKFPTGNWNYKDILPDETGKNFYRRAVYPPAVMPGDGGLGVLVGFDAFKAFTAPRLLTPFTVYASGSYLINPRNQNGTPSMVANLGVPLLPNFADSLTNSVADTYNLQAGVAWKPPFVWDKPNLRGMRFRVTGNLEGLKTRDLFGGNAGFRQPGYALSVGPGFVWSRKKDTIIVDVPIIFNRHINPARSLLPGLPGKPVNGIPTPAPLNFQRQMGLVAPVSISIRYIRSL